jgi:hypothetical protein
VWRLGGAVGIAAILLTVHGSAAGEKPVADLELVLAGDVSGSMTEEELRLQREGLAAAFHDPQVLNAIRSGPLGRIAVTYVEWAGPGEQWIVVPWTMIANQ